MKSYFVRCLWILFLCAPAIRPPTASAAAGDEHWSAQFGIVGVTNSVTAGVTHNDRVYVGVAGNILNHSTLWVWDGNQWSQLATFAGSNPGPFDLEFVGDTLYAGGSFTNVNGVAARGLARFDGANWSAIDFNGTCQALATDGVNLYAGGFFTNAGPVAATNVACWNGSNWQGLGPGVGGKPTDFVSAIVVGNGLVYAGGRYTNSGSAAVTNLAQWNGSSWTSVGGGIGGPSTADRVFALALNGTDLYATGLFTNAGPVLANRIAHWNGANWSALGSGLGAGAQGTSLAARDNLLFLTGTFSAVGGVSATNFAIWNGATWSSAAGGVSSTANRVFLDGDRVYVGGGFAAAGSLPVNFIALWDGANWKALGRAGRVSGLSSFARALANDGTNLYAGGSFSFAGETNAVRAARFDGTNWHSFGTGLNNTVRALALVGTNLYAGGDFTGSAGGPAASHLARWNGANWVPIPGFSSTTVNALATRGNDLFIAGYFTVGAVDGTTTWVARWDGTNLWKALAFEPFTLVAFFIDNIGFTAVAADANYVYVSGRVIMSPCDETLENCTTCSNVMRFDGTYMRTMGTGLNSNANAIVVLDNNVYFAGPFTNASGVAVSGIARWDGAAWFDVGGGIVGNGVINALAVMGTNLYAGGSFTNMGGTPANRVARWNGSAWSALGSGVSFSTGGGVSALTVIGEDLYVGGTVREAGGKLSFFLARWNEGMNFDEAILQLSRPAGDPGNPFQFTVTSFGVPTYVVDRSTDLISWTPFVTNTITPFDGVDTNAPSAPWMFYRARSLQ